MDTLDKIITAPAATVNPAAAGADTLETRLNEIVDEVEDKVEDVADAAEKIASKVNWWAVAGYSAAALAVAVGGYAYWRSRQRTPQNRLERLRDSLGLTNVDIRHLRSTIGNYDFDKLNETRRRALQLAKKATHKSAKRVAELTR